MSVSAASLARVRLKVIPTVAATKASQAGSEGGLDNSTYMTPLRTKQQIDARLVDQATAEAGADNFELMTALRTKQQADARLSSQAEAEAGSNNTKTMTPLRAKQSITVNAEGANFTPGVTDAVVMPMINKLRESVSIKDFGYQPAAGNDWTAQFNKIEPGLKVNVPTGTYNIDGGAVSLSGIDSFSLIGGDDGGNNTVINVASAGDGMVVNGSQRFKIRHLRFQQSHGGAGKGLRVTGISGLYEVSDNHFVSFKEPGVSLEHTSMDPASAAIIARNVFLSCSAGEASPQFRAENANDHYIIENQFGALDLDGPYPAVGALLVNCKAGNYERNYHWENLIGCQMLGHDFSRVIGNRFETNQRQGLQIINSEDVTFVGNHVHTNSMESSGTYDGINFFNVKEASLAGNMVFEWSGGTILMNNSLSCDADCHDITFGENIFLGFSNLPVAYNAASANMRFSNNLPVGYGLDKAYSTWVPGNAAITAGSTLYAGPTGYSANEALVSFIVPTACRAARLIFATDALPGASQTYIVTVRKNGVDTALTATLNNSGYIAIADGSIQFAANDGLSFKIVASAGAASANLRVTLTMEG